MDEMLAKAVFYEESGDVSNKPRDWQYFYTPIAVGKRNCLLQFSVNTLKGNEVYITKIEDVNRERGSNDASSAQVAGSPLQLENFPLSSITLSEFEKEFNEATSKNKHFQINQVDIKRRSIEFRKERNIIRIFKDANKSTFVHEMGHLFLQDIYEHVLSGDASNKAMNDCPLFSIRSPRPDYRLKVSIVEINIEFIIYS